MRQMFLHLCLALAFGLCAQAASIHSGRNAQSQKMTNINQDKNSEAAELVALTNEWTDAIYLA